MTVGSEAGRGQKRIRQGRESHFLHRLPFFPISLALAVASLILGTVGFGAYFQSQGEAWEIFDLVYLSLQLFVFEMDAWDLVGGLPWPLQLARFLAPVTTFFGVIWALRLLLHDTFQEFRLRRKRRHVVVAGLGERGSRIVEQLVGDGYPVVVVERDPSNLYVEGARLRDVPVVIGDARDDETLRRARLQHATHLVAVTSSDDINAELATRAAALGRHDPSIAIFCIVHIANPHLCVLLRAAQLAAGPRHDLHLDFFNTYEHAARALLATYWPASGGSDESPHLLVIGNSALGESIVVEAVRMAWNARDRWNDELVVTLLDPNAEELLARWQGRHPQLGEAARLRAVDALLGPLDPDIVQLSAMPDPQLVCVCLEDGAAGLEVALQMRNLLTPGPGPITVQVTREGGLVGLLSQTGGEHGVGRRIRPFDLMETLRSDLVLGGTYEILARAIHEEYVAEQRRQGTTTATNPAMVPWEELPEALRSSNRDQALHIGVKLATLGHGIAPLAHSTASEFGFSVRDVEFLAKLEHQRWIDERQRDGWRLGPKDHDAKQSPHLIPWEHLSDDVREWDRRAVRGIPAFLARAGYQIVEGPARRTPALHEPES